MKTATPILRTAPLFDVFMDAFTLVQRGWDPNGPKLANGAPLPTCDLSAAGLHSAISALETACGHQIGPGDAVWDAWCEALPLTDEVGPHEWEEAPERTQAQVLAALALVAVQHAQMRVKR